MFINFSRSCPILFLCIKDSRQYFSRVLRILRVKESILQHSGDGNQLTENNGNQEEAEEVEEHNQNMAKEDNSNLLENLFD